MRPLPVTRLAHASLGLTLAVFGVLTWLAGFPPVPVSALPAGVLIGGGLFIAVRSCRMGVECRNGTVYVRGILLTRAVPRARVEEITDFPALRWSDGADRHRWTPIVWLTSTADAFPFVSRHNAREVERLRRWIHGPAR